jgi:hypothetical protein
MDFLTWGALVAAGGSIVAVIKFWVDFGKAAEKAETAATQATLLAASVSQFKVEVAQTYATTRALEAAEAGLARQLTESIQGIYSRLDNVTVRLDNLITTIVGRAISDK